MPDALLLVKGPHSGYMLKWASSENTVGQILLCFSKYNKQQSHGKMHVIGFKCNKWILSVFCELNSIHLNNKQL